MHVAASEGGVMSAQLEVDLPGAVACQSRAAVQLESHLHGRGVLL